MSYLPPRHRNDSEPILWPAEFLLFQFLVDKLPVEGGTLKPADAWLPIQPAESRSQTVGWGWSEERWRCPGEEVESTFKAQLSLHLLSTSFSYIEIRLYPTLRYPHIGRNSGRDSISQVAFDSILREKSKYILWVDPQTAPSATRRE